MCLRETQGEALVRVSQTRAIEITIFQDHAWVELPWFDIPFMSRCILDIVFGGDWLLTIETLF